MSQRRYTLAELGLTQMAADDLIKGRAIVMPAPRWLKPEVYEAARVISDPGELEWPAVAFFAYGQMVAASPYGLGNIPRMPACSAAKP